LEVIVIGFGQRLSYAFRTFFSILSNGEIPTEVARELIETPAAVPPPVEKGEEVAPPLATPPVETTDRAVQILALLQRDGRLIDFLTEDLSPYQDAQVGAAVREMHESCRGVLERYIKLEPVIASDEGKPVTVPAGFDPAAIKLIGNVTGVPPLRGVLQHRGWRATEVKLPPLPEGEGRVVVAPAEVEIS
jgi:hypothetical protein